MPDTWKLSHPIPNVSDVEFIGIRLMNPTDRRPVYWEDDTGQLVKEIGDLLDPRDGRLFIFPRTGTTPDEHGILLAAASESYTGGRSDEDNWVTYTRQGTSRHRTTIIIPADTEDSQDGTAAVIAGLVDIEPRERQHDTVPDQLGFEVSA